MDTGASPDIAYILGRLSMPLVVGGLVALYFRLTRKRHLNKKEKKIVIWTIVVLYILMILTAASKVGNSTY